MTIRKDAGWLDPGTRWGPEGSAIIRADIDKIKILYGITQGRRTTALTWSTTSRTDLARTPLPRCPRLPGPRNSAWLSNRPTGRVDHGVRGAETFRIRCDRAI